MPKRNMTPHPNPLPAKRGEGIGQMTVPFRM